MQQLDAAAKQQFSYGTNWDYDSQKPNI
jgi:hypothetical protein